MKGIFVIREGDQLFTYNDFEEIPSAYDNLIEFKPEYPPPPHTKEQHDYIDTFGRKLDELMNRERRNASSN